ncbi:uncharacterized protein ACHE_70291A [Aspergillus chevalieri]|uniref:Uncharacterized protein n=1 Tax=Aspergillus chevalieri TaxID=182096 RepID=A0A7R7VWC3_ASPCH|nr:uncharacterized protein ACHE_70291A [Aspergillus chevalieri]BCR91448.1 hypothetical protein ACHE_70291A [Aspergillus chevalieri]
MYEEAGDDETLNSKEHFERALVRAEGWVAMTPDDHPACNRRIETFNPMPARRNNADHQSPRSPLTFDPIPTTEREPSRSELLE